MKLRASFIRAASQAKGTTFMVKLLTVDMFPGLKVAVTAPRFTALKVSEPEQLSTNELGADAL